MKRKKIDVVISTFNPKPFYLQAQIESLLGQSIGIENFDVTIRDDGSTKEESLCYLKSLSSNPNVKVDFGKNVGVFGSFLSLIEKAYIDGYDFVSLSDQDDIALPNKLKLALDFFEKEDNGIPLLFFSQMTYVDDRLKMKGLPLVNEGFLGFRNALFESSINGNLMVLNRKACEIVISKKPQYFYMHDWWIYLCIAAFGKILFSPESTLLYRQHENNVIGGSQAFFDILKRRIKRFRDYSVNTYPVYKQGKEFKELFANELSMDNLQILNNLLNSKNSFWRRIHYALSMGNFIRMSSLDNILVRILILLNKY